MASLTEAEAAMPESLTIGQKVFQRGEDYTTMTDSTALYSDGDFKALQARLDEDGYLLLRGIVKQADVEKARTMMLHQLQLKGGLKHGTKTDDAFIRFETKKNKYTAVKGWTVDAESGGVVANRDPDYISWRKIGNSKELTNVYNGPALNDVFHNILGNKAKSQPNCTWLRMRTVDALTVAHADYYYFKNNTDLFAGNRLYKPVDTFDDLVCDECKEQNENDDMIVCDLCDYGFHLKCVKPQVKSIPKGEWHCPHCANSQLPVYTCWVSLGKNGYQNGVLAMRPGTHKLDGYDRPRPGRELPHEYERVPHRRWETTEFGPGDIVLFSIRTVHAATKNLSDRFRLSLDTRVVKTKIAPRKPYHLVNKKPKKEAKNTKKRAKPKAVSPKKSRQQTPVPRAKKLKTGDKAPPSVVR